MGNISNKTGLFPCRCLFSNLVYALFQSAGELPRSWRNLDVVFIQGTLWDTDWEMVGAKGYFSSLGSEAWTQWYIIAGA